MTIVQGEINHFCSSDINFLPRYLLQIKMFNLRSLLDDKDGILGWVEGLNYLSRLANNKSIC